jgi:hypothetical protein
MQRRKGRRHMILPTDITNLINHPGAKRLGRGLAALVEAQERQPVAPLPVDSAYRAALKEWLGVHKRKPPRPTLSRVAKQARTAAIAVARYEVKPDGTIAVVTGKGEPAAPENPWPLDEFRRKETKQ